MAATAKKAAPGRRDIATLWHSLVGQIFDPYRPELHYMRGPGPKWREKHLAHETERETPSAAVAEAAA